MAHTVEKPVHFYVEQKKVGDFKIKINRKKRFKVYYNIHYPRISGFLN